MRKTGSPLRQAINKHLFREHEGFVGHGTTDNRLIQHEILHAKGDASHQHEVWDEDPSNFTDTQEG